MKSSSRYIPEVWYRPELEEFDVSYNDKHAERVMNSDVRQWATLVTKDGPWRDSTEPGNAIITTETLYFPELIPQLVSAA